MNVSEALRSRRSVRYFGKQEVPEETLRSIVDDAIHAPSWCDAQPWKVYIATGSRALEIRENHRGIAEPGLKGHSDLAAGHREDWGERACANMARLGSEVMGFLGDDGNQIADCQRDLFDAPAIVYLTMHKGTPDFGKLDMGGFAQSLMLSAESEELPVYLELITTEGAGASPSAFLEKNGADGSTVHGLEFHITSNGSGAGSDGQGLD